MKLVTLADVRKLIKKHLPKDRRERPTWRHVAAQLDEAAAGGDTADVSIALRMALMLEGLECGRPLGSMTSPPKENTATSASYESDILSACCTWHLSALHLSERR